MKTKASEDNSSKAVKGRRTKAAPWRDKRFPCSQKRKKAISLPTNWKHRGVRDHRRLLSPRATQSAQGSVLFD